MSGNGGAVDVLVVGGGLGGLSAACHLVAAGRKVRVLDAGDRPGGRVRTVEVDGYKLDCGFQVLLSAYPAARAILDYPGLDLRAYEPGALIRVPGGWTRVADPWRRPGLALATATSSVGTLGDKLRIARLRLSLRSGSKPDRFQRPEWTTAHYLAQLGFSSRMVERFFRPFFGGIFLDPDLSSSSRMFEFLFRMFAEGQAMVPAGGMQAIPAQLAARLPAGSLLLGAEVVRVGDGEVELATGERHTGAAIIVAAGAGTPGLVEVRAPRGWRAVTNLHFAADHPPDGVGRFLVLNGEGRGPINNLSVPTNLDPGLAPEAESLVSVTVLGPGEGNVERPVRAQLREWFGSATAAWRLLRLDRISQALPTQSPPWYTRADWPVRIRPGVYAAGDLIDTASIDGALRSGRRAAEAVLTGQ